MTAMIGNYSLCAAVLVAAGTILAALSAAKAPSAAALRAARWGIGVMAGLFTISSIALLVSLVQSDFSLAYVASYTELKLPIGYKLAAFWAGQEGSLLLWAWALGIMALILVITRRRDEGREHAVALLALSVVCGFFAALMLFAANPFIAQAVTPADGHGLNPMLQNIGMIAHPPALFLGYAGFTIPFVLMLGALVSGKVDAQWLAVSRRWILASWLFLTIGIVLGAQWAYVELGWGGYWAWDPVENASLLPWLTGTALLHSVMVQQHRNMFRVWNPVLAAVTFLLCIFGTYLTRSGVIESVHAFEKSLIGTFFLFFLVLCTIISAAVILIRVRLLRYQRPLESMVSREGASLVGIILLSVMTALTLLGTIFPIISRTLTGDPVTVKQNFYNVAVLPFALVVVAAMAVAPFLSYGAVAGSKLLRDLRIPVIISVLTAIVVWILGGRRLWAVATALAVGMIVTGIVMDFIRCCLLRMRNGGENPLVAAVRLVDSNHRRYGGHVVHLGIAMIVAGVAGSSLFNQKENFELAPGQSATLGRYRLTLQSVQDLREANFNAVQAQVMVDRGDGQPIFLQPQIRKYDKAEQRNGEVAIHFNWREDLYLTLAGASDDRSLVAIQAIINPLVIWIWIGGIAMTLGGLLCLLPPLLPASRRSEVPAAAPADATGIGTAVQPAS